MERNRKTPVDAKSGPRPGPRARALSFSAPAALFALLTVAGCSNSRFAGALSDLSSSSTSSQNSGSSTNSSSSTTTDPTVPTYKISSVNIAAPANANGQAGMNATILFDATKSSGPVSNSCNVATNSAQTAKPCSCLFTWQEINQTGGSSIPIPRTVQTPVGNVQPNLVVCAAPSVYTAEIPDGTVIKITVIASGTSTEKFLVPTFNFNKQGAVQTGSFQDSEGRAYDNIFRYACYEQFKRGMKIGNKTIPQQNPRTGEPATFRLATAFCISKPGGAPGGSGCEGGNNVDNSAQAYYYNLFIRNTDRGQINLENTRYKCPKVKETLATVGNTGSSNDFWPLDTTFALALTSNPDFPVGVEAFSKVGGTDSASKSTSCFAAADAGGGGGGADDTGSLIHSCLGFAAKPNPDGTCPYFRDSNGLIRFTYRLRRFISLYPPVFDTNGNMVGQVQATDTVYVLDRPVSSPSADPLRPFTMRGPKPCPFAYFDHTGVLGDPNDADYPGGMPKYAGTANPSWNGVNVDGIEFPNTDSADSCSTAMPLLSADKTRWSIGTVNATNPVMRRVFIRPVNAWAPHYEEDTDFQACAPQASPFVDPPLHFAKDPSTGNISWCAESYPSQNQYVGDIDKRKGTNGNYPSKVIPFTSHVVKNSASSTCVRTLPDLSGLQPPLYLNPGSNPGACTPLSATDVGVAHHPDYMIVDSTPKVGANCGNGSLQTGNTCYYCAQLTCDRTVQNVGLAWPKFPLIARATQVESAIAGDTTYSCGVTFDNGGGKTGKSTPTQGCCGANVKVWTGVAPNAASPDTLKNTAGHLEPSTVTPCLVPAY